MPEPKKMKLSDISSLLFECKRELKMLGDVAEDNGDTKWVEHIDDLYTRVLQAREAIQKRNVEID